MNALNSRSIQGDVLQLFRHGRPVHLDTFRNNLHLTDKQVRSAIDRLRNLPGIQINWDGAKTWCLK